MTRLGTVATEKKQTTRMLRVKCPCCGFIYRTTAKWLADKTELRCPDLDCGEIFTLDCGDEDE
jgi:hypothetical protein